jgi:hypothetical protein
MRVAEFFGGLIEKVNVEAFVDTVGELLVGGQPERFSDASDDDDDDDDDGTCLHAIVMP